MATRGACSSRRGWCMVQAICSTTAACPPARPRRVAPAAAALRPSTCESQAEQGQRAACGWVRAHATAASKLPALARRAPAALGQQARLHRAAMRPCMRCGLALPPAYLLECQPLLALHNLCLDVLVLLVRAAQLIQHLLCCAPCSRWAADSQQVGREPPPSGGGGSGSGAAHMPALPAAGRAPLTNDCTSSINTASGISCGKLESGFCSAAAMLAARCRALRIRGRSSLGALLKLRGGRQGQRRGGS